MKIMPRKFIPPVRLKLKKKLLKMTGGIFSF